MEQKIYNVARRLNKIGYKISMKQVFKLMQLSYKYQTGARGELLQLESKLKAVKFGYKFV